MEPILLEKEQLLLWNESRGNVVAMFREPVSYSPVNRLLYQGRQYRVVVVAPDRHSVLLRQIIPPPYENYA